MAEIKATSLQDVIKSLEEYKRYLGRKYDMATCPPTKAKLFGRYNAVEQQIEYLVHEHGCTRYSKPYTLKDKLDMLIDGEVKYDPPLPTRVEELKGV